MMYMLNNGLAEIDIKYQYLVPESHVRTSRHLRNYKLPQILILSKNHKRIRTACRKTFELPSLASFKARLAKHF